MNKNDEIHGKVAKQFTDTATAYATSAVHANPVFLNSMVELVQPRPTDHLLDLATGSGNVVLAFAPLVARAIALDLTQTMLDHVAISAKEQGLTNVETILAPAEAIPLEDGSLDIVTVRLAPHHFADVPGFLEEANRVLKQSGKFLLVDTSVPDDPILDAEINRLELLRDPSHVRNYSAKQWQAMISEAGFEVLTCVEAPKAGGVTMDFDDWTQRIRAPKENLGPLREGFVNASPDLKKVLRIELNGESISFSLPEVTILAKKIR